MTESDAATYFGGRTSVYDSAYDRVDADGHALRARLAVVLGVLGSGGGEALDAGMGPGRLCAELDARGWIVSGIDASEQMVEVARDRLPMARERLLRAEIEALPFAPDSFDAVAATGVLEYADITRAVSELARVLRPGGIAVLSYPNPTAIYGVWKTQVWYRATRFVKRVLQRPHPDLPRGAGRIPPERFEQLLRSAGLESESRQYSSYLPMVTPLELLFPRLAARAGARFEGSGRLTGRLLATQTVFAARKPR